MRSPSQQPRVIHGFNPFGDAPSASPSTSLYTRIPGMLPPPAGLLDCNLCSVRAEAMRVVPGEGPADAPIYVLGQNPGEEEDREGRPFVGMSGEQFNGWLQILGIERTRIFVTNLVKCHTTDNRALKAAEVQVCSNRWLVEELQALPQVQVIIPLGKPAVERILGKSAPPMTPISVYHYRIQVLGREVSVFPLPHPAFFLRAPYYGQTFREVLLPQIRETLQQELPTVYAACQRS